MQGSIEKIQKTFSERKIPLSGHLVDAKMNKNMVFLGSASWPSKAKNF